MAKAQNGLIFVSAAFYWPKQFAGQPSFKSGKVDHLFTGGAKILHCREHRKREG